MDRTSRIADAVLYEGYILWPYRRSATKNQRRWTFGGVYPEGHSTGRVDDPSLQQTQCLLEGDSETRLDVRVRFLHVVERKIARATAAGETEYVDELDVGDERYLAWDEAAEREVGAAGLSPPDLVEKPHRIDVSVAAGVGKEPLAAPAGEQVATLVRRWRALEGAVEIRAEHVRGGVFRLTVQTRNTSPWQGGSRDDALRQTFVSTHTVLQAEAGSFVSLTDPPAEVRDVAEGCENIGTWPVLVGEEGDRHTLLSSPIILPDYPQISDDSPGDLFDGTEIDEMLTLNILGLSDAEKQEMRASDPRAREILDRTAALTPEQMMKLHGTVRELRAVRPS